MTLLINLLSNDIIIFLSLLPIAFILLRTIYRLSPFHPLSHIPGPFLPRMSSLWLTYHAWLGNECRTVHSLHTHYKSSIVRTGPRSVDIADGAALHDIYVLHGGFHKPAFYGNFRIDGHESIFSETNPQNRAPRAKAVLPMFATGSLRAGKETLEGIVARFVKEVEKVRKGEGVRKVVNVLELTRGLAIDVVTGYLFDRAYGGLPSEDKGEVEPGSSPGEMSANGMVDVFVAVGRFWYLPGWAFQWAEWFDTKFGVGSAKEVGESLDRVDEYVAGIVKDAEQAVALGKGDATVNGVSSTSYPARLLSAGFTVSEVRAQCKDLIFAGTDSTGTNLATIMFYLAKQPETYRMLREELQKNTNVTDLMEIQAMPCLRGIIREGLRLSMANPSRLARVVPSSGWTFQGVDFPPGTEVSCTPYELHLNPDVFPDPHAFRPERWIEDSSKSDQMDRDAIPFGLGSRQCIARNLAAAELFLAVKALAEADCLANAHPVRDKIEILEWFNSHIVGGKIEISWV